MIKKLTTLPPFYTNTEKPGFNVKLASKIGITVKERFSVRCVLFEGGRKFYDVTGQKTVPNKRTCLNSIQQITIEIPNELFFTKLSERNFLKRS